MHKAHCTFTPQLVKLLNRQLELIQAQQVRKRFCLSGRCFLKDLCAKGMVRSRPGLSVCGHARTHLFLALEVHAGYVPDGS